MIYLIITNRPNFIPFALKQAGKCADVKVVVLGNGEGFKDYSPDCEFYYKEEWEHCADAFNWFRINCPYHEDLFLMDDDIYLKKDVVADVEYWLQKGFDRVMYTMSGMYDVKGNRYAITKWLSHKIGGAWGMSKDIWRLEKWGSYKVDAMLSYFKRLPEHNVKLIPKADIIHLLHGKNTVLRPRDKFDWTERSDTELLQEIKEINFN